MKILITGGFGFLGRHLLRAINRVYPNFGLIVIDNLPKGKIPHAYIKNFRLRWHIGDITQESFVSRVFREHKPEIIIHLAALHYIPECETQPAKSFLVNVLGTYNIIKCANQFWAKQLIFSSSAAVYKPSTYPIKERDKILGADIYSTTKIIGESIIQNQSVIPWTIFRLFNIIGPGETHEHLVETITNQIKTKTKYLKLGNLKTKRDYIFVEDVVKVLIQSVNNPKCFFQILNVGTGIPTSGKEIINIIEGFTDQKIKYTTSNKRLRRTDNPILLANNKKIKSLLKWKPAETVASSLHVILKSKRII